MANDSFITHGLEITEETEMSVREIAGELGKEGSPEASANAPQGEATAERTEAEQDYKALAEEAAAREGAERQQEMSQEHEYEMER
jgi:hypothetical protein